MQTSKVSPLDTQESSEANTALDQLGAYMKSIIRERFNLAKENHTLRQQLQEAKEKQTQEK